MKRGIALALIGGLLTAAAGCTGPDGLARDLAANLDELTASIKNKEPADRQKLLLDRLKSTVGKVNKLELGEDGVEAWGKRHESELKAAVERLLDAADASGSNGVAVAVQAIGILAEIGPPKEKGAKIEVKPTLTLEVK